MDPAPERKLSTILAADVVGYSAMMGRDEPGTLAQLQASRAAFAEEITRRRGRVFNTAGDSLLAEFPSVVNAVECAVNVQRRLKERNAALPEERRMRFRIGVNLGDVLVEGDELYGDGVNIAARLQALAEPGGILVSGPVFEQVRNKLSLGFDFLGPQPVKNIAEPVPAWRVVLDAEEAAVGANRGNARSGRTSSGAAPAGPKPGVWMRMKRPVAFAAVFIAFLFAIDLLASDHSLWFYWPALGILLLLGLRAAWLLGR